MSFFKKIKEKLFGKKENTINLGESREKVNLETDKYVAGLEKSNISFSQQIIELTKKHNKIDEEYFDELEETLIMSDITPSFVSVIVHELKREVRNQNLVDTSLIPELIVDKMYTIYANRSIVNTNLNIQKNRLNVILVVGVNGSGKTTSISKIAHKLIQEGNKLLIIAGDTFRAAAVEQLEIWANRVEADILKPNEKETDPGSVVYRGLEKAINEKFDVVIIDTAGRLQNKVNLMNELKKVNKIIADKVENAPHESLLVIDATTGQNGVLQAKHFADVTPISGIVLTKMDGTSKGGIIFSIKDQLNIDVKLVGLGEKMDDLQPFDLDKFIYSMTRQISKEYE